MAGKAGLAAGSRPNERLTAIHLRMAMHDCRPLLTLRHHTKSGGQYASLRSRGSPLPGFQRRMSGTVNGDDKVLRETRLEFIKAE
jgi:hypothetical protein